MNRWMRAISTAAALAALSFSVPALADGHGHGGGRFSGGGGGRAGYSMPHGAAPSGGRMGMAPSRSAGFSAPRSVAPVNHGGRFGSTPRSAAPINSGSRFGSTPRSAAPINSGGRFGSTPRSGAPINNGGRFNSAPRPVGPVNHAGRFGSTPPSTGFSRPAPTHFSGTDSHFRNMGGRYGYTPGHAYNRPGVGPGFHHPVHIGVGARPRYWAGGYYRGHYWPGAHYHHGYVRFVTVLPAYYSTFWFSGLPYYYWDDTYYTWSPSSYGYIATDPPPVVQDGDDSSDSGTAQPESSGPSSDPSNLYIYPKNGQSEEQTSNDRYECHQWAAGQTGFDPTKGADQSAGSSGPDDYRRAMIACLDARGYSAN